MIIDLGKDVVGVVRCKDCVHRHSSEYCECRPDDAYCSDGERENKCGDCVYLRNNRFYPDSFCVWYDTVVSGVSDCVYWERKEENDESISSENRS